MREARFTALLKSRERNISSVSVRYVAQEMFM